MSSTRRIRCGSEFVFPFALMSGGVLSGLGFVGDARSATAEIPDKPQSARSFASKAKGKTFRTTAVPITTAKLPRPLITLIYAGRNRMDMIRRELPRTRSAGWVRKPFRIILVEGSPFRVPSAVIDPAVVRDFKILGRLREFELRFGIYGNGPHEAEQFAGERRHNFASFLAAGCHGGVSLMQPFLRFPGDSFGFVAERQAFCLLSTRPCTLGRC